MGEIGRTCVVTFSDDSFVIAPEWLADVWRCLPDCEEIEDYRTREVLYSANKNPAELRIDK